MLNTRIVVTQYGGREVLEAIEEPLRQPQQDEIRIKVQSAGVALADVMRREGVYPHSPKPPFTPGYDAVGLVDEVGAGVTVYSIGDRVGVFYDGVGGYAAFVYAKEKEVFKVPTDVRASRATAVILNYVTAYQLLHRLAKVNEGDSILVHGASGGVGTALLELGRLASLRMFGTASKAKHAVVADFGAVPIDYRNEDFVEVLAECAPAGMDAVFDPIGGDNWLRSFQTLSSQGRFVGYGYTSVLGESTSDAWVKDWSDLQAAQTTCSGNPAYLYSITALRKEQPEWFKEDLSAVFSLLQKGAINPIISHEIPLLEAARAQQLLEQSSASGKIVLVGE
ncbi:oxidoreductase [Paenibacillus baekrokdamisoli]|uniref:Oxidoreductase n=1 Tax=Paenibacillus baekrokdamisoli TaxID=1712516 RepID=A0A3G9JAI5_9BACL|nr:medium chain dehydrogenase/reductase family protein [Paenibacillus baekrokdamisoli]MBB3068085.1 NADPH:quinone reductase-like Zn-dependent oxidoreductase [Paenibacillus baekrokdamisoli]BBH22871.1 oxidoreductase [Paenibacillus baekrokdamisoli]